MLTALLKVSGMLTLRLVYGKKYTEECSERLGLIILLSFANSFWLISLLFLFVESDILDTIISAIMAIGYPAVIAFWALRERKKQD